ncbi:MAG: sugar ABC transporter permease, partial [Clostridia bacterium]|nr:sugar ABC transporter permease [Clostridia bacterium]
MSQAQKTDLRNQPLGVRFQKAIGRDWQLWVLMLPALVFFLVFCYFPMYGIQIAFKDYKAAFGILDSEWVGLEHFQTFFSSYYCGRMFANTLLLNVYGLLFGFPLPILLAIMLNQLGSERFKGFTQTAIYVPHFISTVVLAGMIYIFLSPTNGIINHLLTSMGRNSIYFMAESRWFRPIYIITGIWQNAGWDSILYIA